MEGGLFWRVTDVDLSDGGDSHEQSRKAQRGTAQRRDRHYGRTDVDIVYPALREDAAPVGSFYSLTRSRRLSAR